MDFNDLPEAKRIPAISIRRPTPNNKINTWKKKSSNPFQETY